MVLAPVGDGHEGKANSDEGGVSEGELVAEQGGDDRAGEHGRTDARREFPPETWVVHRRLVFRAGVALQSV